MIWQPAGPWRLNEWGEWTRRYRYDWTSRFCGRDEQRTTYRFRVVPITKRDDRSA